METKRHLNTKKIISETDYNRFFLMLEKRYSDPDLTVDIISKSIGMSRFTLFRKLKTVLDETPSSVIRTYRLEKAASILSIKNDTITSIAYSVGFNDVQYFCKCFKEQYKLTPREYQHICFQ